MSIHPCVLCGTPKATALHGLCPECVSAIVAAKLLLRRLFSIPLN